MKSPLALAAVVAVLVAGCTSVPRSGAPQGTTAQRAPSASGKYYLDDGPGANAPDLDAVPDAVPRLEPLARAANRPYEVFGRQYVPATMIAPYRERGIASWYGRRFHGQKTSIGEPYDMYAMTAAHPTLPLPSYARVTNVATGKSVIVRVNDRGPFLHGRIIDLSYAAAHRIGIAQAGSGEVEVEAILPGTYAQYARTAPAPTTVASAASTRSPPLPADAPVGRVAVENTSAAVVTTPIAPVSTVVPDTMASASTPQSPIVSPVVPDTVTRMSTLPPATLATPATSVPPTVAPATADVPSQAVELAPVAPTRGGYSVQLGAFANYANAQAFLAHAQNQLAAARVEARIRQAGGLYRVYVGPYTTRSEAERLSARITQAFGFPTTIAAH